MEVKGGEEEGFVREWTPCTHMLNLIPPRVQTGLFSSELCLTCIDAVTEYIALGTNVGLVYWYDRKKGNIQRLRCEAATSPITYVKIANTVDYMVAAGNVVGQVTVFQIPKEHPENIPDTLKPKVEPKVERYTIGDLHKSPVTAIEWSKNGMRLFSGDKNGVIIMSEIDFYMHLCKSMEIVNEQHEIVQLSYHNNCLLVSSVYRTIVCERDGNKWRVTQIGKKERKSLSRLGAVFQHSYSVGGGGAAAAYCSRQHLRLWRADTHGHVLQTLLFKEAVANPLTIVELLNPCTKPRPESLEPSFGPLFVYRESFLVTHDDRCLYILDPRSLTAVAVVDNLRSIISVSVSRDEIFIVEGGRSVLRLARTPDSPQQLPDDPIMLMTRSLTSSFQQAVNTMRDLTQIDQTVPFITSVLEQPISIIANNEYIDSGPITKAEECFELPPIRPLDASDNVLESIINEFKDVSSEAEEIRRVKTQELEKKLKIYNKIMERKYDGELIHSSRRSRSKSGGRAAAARAGGRAETLTTPCVMNVSVYNDLHQENDDDLEKQIEEKEKILAKMLNIDSLSIKTKTETNTTHNEITAETSHDVTDDKGPVGQPIEKVQVQKSEENLADLVPKIVKAPNNWNLELKIDLPESGFSKESLVIGSPDDHLDEWEIV